MNENELRQALRATMATTTPPPPMSETPVLDAARRAAHRRRARWAGAGSAAAAVAVVGVAVVVVAATSGAGGSQPGGLGGATSTSRTPTGEQSSGTGQPSGTKPSWPNGQTDRTAHNGPEYDRGVALLAALDAAVPAGYTAPDDLKGTGELAGAPMKFPQAQFQDTVDGVEVWDYSAEAVVTKGGRYGRLIAEVQTPGNAIAGEGCDLSDGLWGMDSTCTETVVDGKRVGLFTKTDDGDQFDQWAGYRYDDGTVVFVGQASFRAYTNFPPLAGEPLPVHRLAELATDPAFRLD